VVGARVVVVAMIVVGEDAWPAPPPQATPRKGHAMAAAIRQMTGVRTLGMWPNHATGGFEPAVHRLASAGSSDRI
jgi:hypothetical protein